MTHFPFRCFQKHPFWGRSEDAHSVPVTRLDPRAHTTPRGGVYSRRLVDSPHPPPSPRARETCDESASGRREMFDDIRTRGPIPKLDTASARTPWDSWATHDSRATGPQFSRRYYLATQILSPTKRLARRDTSDPASIPDYLYLCTSCLCCPTPPLQREDCTTVTLDQVLREIPLADMCP